MFSTSRNWSSETYVIKDNAGDVSQILSLKFTPQTTPSPIGTAGLWENEADGNLYFNGTNISAVGPGTGNVIAPFLQTVRTIPTWDYSYNTLTNGKVDINTIAEIGSVNPVKSLSLAPATSFPSNHTIWSDGTTGNALSYDSTSVVTFDKVKVSLVNDIPHFTTNDGTNIEGTGFVMPKFDVRENLLISNFFSSLDPGAMLNCVSLGTQLSNNCVASNPLTWTEGNVLVGNQLGNGLGALANNHGYNVMIGNNIGAADGTNNVLIGGNIMGSGNPGTTPLSNVIAIGYGAGLQLQSGDNILVGTQAGYSLTSPASVGNIVIGNGGLSSAPYSSYNILIGEDAGNNTTEAGFGSNVGIGKSCFGSATTAVGNVAIGTNTAPLLTSGARNLLLGIDTGAQLTTGSRNIIIGNTSGSGSGLVDGNDNILINTIVDTTDTERTISIGVPGTHIRTFIQGIYGVPIDSPTAYVFVNSAGQLGTSSLMPASMKAEVKDLSESFINKSLDLNVKPIELDVNELKNDVATLRGEIDVLKKRCDALNATNVALFKRLGGGAVTTTTCI